MEDKFARLPEELLRAASGGDRDAVARIVIDFQPFVIAIARRYASYVRLDGAMDSGDLVQEGNLGLIKAIGSFDFDRSRNYMGYFEYAIRTAMREALSNFSRAIRLPRFMSERIRKIENASKDLAAEDVLPSVDSIAVRTGLKKAEVEKAMDAYSRQNLLSLDAPAESDDGKPGRLMDAVAAEDSSDDPFDGYLLESLDDRLAELPEEDYFIISSVYGLAGRRKIGRSELSRILGTTRTKLDRRTRMIESSLRAII